MGNTGIAQVNTAYQIRKAYTESGNTITNMFDTPLQTSEYIYEYKFEQKEIIGLN